MEVQLETMHILESEILGVPCAHCVALILLALWKSVTLALVDTQSVILLPGDDCCPHTGVTSGTQSGPLNEQGGGH